MLITTWNPPTSPPPNDTPVLVQIDEHDIRSLWRKNDRWETYRGNEIQPDRIRAWTSA